MEITDPLQTLKYCASYFPHFVNFGNEMNMMVMK